MSPISNFDFRNPILTRAQENLPALVPQFDLFALWRSESKSPSTGLELIFRWGNICIVLYIPLYYSINCSTILIDTLSRRRQATIGPWLVLCIIVLLDHKERIFLTIPLLLHLHRLYGRGIYYSEWCYVHTCCCLPCPPFPPWRLLRFPFVSWQHQDWVFPLSSTQVF